MYEWVWRPKPKKQWTGTLSRFLTFTVTLYDFTTRTSIVTQWNRHQHTLSFYRSCNSILRELHIPLLVSICSIYPSECLWCLSFVVALLRFKNRYRHILCIDSWDAAIFRRAPLPSLPSYTKHTAPVGCFYKVWAVCICLTVNFGEGTAIETLEHASLH